MEKRELFQEDKQGKFKRQTSKQAIALAMEGRWQESVDINKSIIENFPNDPEAYNRLGKAYMELGEYANSKEAYEKASKLDQYNTIAKKNLQRLALLENAASPVAEGLVEKAPPQLFIEEIGKAGVVNLYQIASPDKLVKMLAGDKVSLKPQDSSLAVFNLRGDYLGLVPSKHGQRLLKLMGGGNKYTAAVVASSDNAISVIIREIYQDPKLSDQVSFPGRKLEEIQSYTGEKISQPGFGEEGELVEALTMGDEETDAAEEPIEDVEEDKDWEQEA
jgi:tetratricopeptide (TPR) repeat protein